MVNTVSNDDFNKIFYDDNHQKSINRISKKYRKYIEYDDILSAAQFAIFKAIKKYDSKFLTKEGKSVSFNTFFSCILSRDLTQMIRKNYKYMSRRRDLGKISEIIILKENVDIKEVNLNGLSEQEQKVVHLKYFENKTLKEMSSIYNITIQGVHQKLRRILNKLKKGVNTTVFIL